MHKCGKKGFKVLRYPNCGSKKTTHYGRNSRICTHCGRIFTNKWADQIARKTFNVKHRHIVLTIQDEPKTTV